MAALPRASSSVDWRNGGSSSRWSSAAIVVGLHVALIAGLLQLESVRTALFDAAPVMATLITPPKKVQHPLESRVASEEGRVILRVFVNDRGVPEEVQVRTSSGYTRLDTVAQDTVRRWKFVPAKRGDTPIGAWVLVPMTFSLRN